MQVLAVWRLAVGVLTCRKGAYLRVRPDRSTIDKSMADRDYRMSTYDRTSDVPQSGIAACNIKSKPHKINR